jgi:hypothetical protein
VKCIVCEDCAWVCEKHPAIPWEGPHGGACAPCPVCNGTKDGNAPRLPAGFKTAIDKDGSRH